MAAELNITIESTTNKTGFK